jgi:hypothetical protein
VRALGLQLDRGIFPQVLDGGAVAPSESAIPPYMGAEKFNVQARTPPLTSGASTSTTSSQGTAGIAGPPGETPSLERAGVRAFYENEVAALQVTYPGTRAWCGDAGMWLLSESSVVAGLKQAATFLTAFSWSILAVKAWGFWRESAVSVRWIGPRHTNFPDGSVCAFDPADKTWIFGDPLIELLDLYSVWALRHLHLEMFHHWPGPQSVFHPYERQLEFHHTELCVCGSGRAYGNCCLSRDTARSAVTNAVSFIIQFAGGLREPPAYAAQAALHATTPPPVSVVQW